MLGRLGMHDRVVDGDDLAVVDHRAGDVDLVAQRVADAVGDRRFAVARRAVHQDRAAGTDRRAEVVEQFGRQDQVAHRRGELVAGDLDVADRLALDLFGVAVDRHRHRAVVFRLRRAHRARAPCRCPTAGSPSRCRRRRAACRAPRPGSGRGRCRSGPAPPGLGIASTRSRSVTVSRFMRNIVLRRMSRIITGVSPVSAMVLQAAAPARSTGSACSWGCSVVSGLLSAAVLPVGLSGNTIGG